VNPFDLAGPHFLALYLVVLVVVVVAALAARWWLRQPGDEPPLEALDLPPYEAACLAGGEWRAMDAAIVRLIHQGVIDADAAASRLSRRPGARQPKAHPLESVIFDEVREGGTAISQVRQRAGNWTAKIRTRLEKLGLVIPPPQGGLVRLVPGLFLVGVALFGGVKIMVGASRNRPVGILVFLVIVTVIFAIAFFAWRPYRSRRGDRALRQLKEANAALEYAAGRRLSGLNDNDLVLALGLFGLGILAGGPLSGLQAALKPPPPVGSGGGSGCGGGGCGGGCGGGGCGGCGG
jgi:uncharacterized protein (TIGR04222 family)